MISALQEPGFRANLLHFRGSGRVVVNPYITERLNDIWNCSPIARATWLRNTEKSATAGGSCNTVCALSSQLYCDGWASHPTSQSRHKHQKVKLCTTW